MKSLVIGIITYFGIVPVFLAYAVLADGFALMLMWDWFLSQPFGIPRLSMLHAAGISAIIGLVSHQFNDVADSSWKKHTIHIVFNPWFRLVVAWVVYKAMVSL